MVPSSSVTPSSSVIPPPDNNVNSSNKKVPKPSNVKKSYAQASKNNISPNVEDILQIKEAFPTLSAEEVGKMIKGKNISRGQRKPRINMTTKGPSRKQIIILITKLNAELIINSANQFITNINKCLKEITSDIYADFIHIINNGVIITTNKPANASDLKIIEKCIKNSNNVDSKAIESPRLPKSKSYLKIIGLPYMEENGPITPNIIEGVLKEMHIFNNIILASKLCIIKVSPKSDMAVVWVNIWNSQNGSAAKNLINRHFNIGRYIATVRGMNMNPGVPQCKNCWK